MTAPEVTVTQPKRPKPSPCGWCGTGFGGTPGCHDTGSRCHPIRNGVPASVRPDRMWDCPCAEAGHPGRAVTVTVPAAREPARHGDRCPR